MRVPARTRNLARATRRRQAWPRAHNVWDPVAVNVGRNSADVTRQDREHRWGSASFIGAVLERLGATPTGVAIDDQDRNAVDGMLTVAARLSEAGPGIPLDAAN
jgi:hypothetical protein